MPPYECAECRSATDMEVGKGAAIGIEMSDGDLRADWAAAAARRLSFEADMVREGLEIAEPACRLCIDLDASRLRSDGEESRSFDGVSSRDMSEELEFVRGKP
jgi:hypothetical protein